MERIPKTNRECYALLDKMLSEEDKQAILCLCFTNSYWLHILQLFDKFNQWLAVNGKLFQGCITVRKAPIFFCEMIIAICHML